MKNLSIIKETSVANILQAQLYSNGIVEITWDKKVEVVEVMHLQKMQEAVKELGEGKKMLLFFTTPDFIQVSDAGRKFAASKEGTVYSLAIAVQVDNSAKKFLFNFFVNFSKPIVPTKSFSTKQEAFKWLEKTKNSAAKAYFAV